MLGSGLQKLGTKVQGSERLVLAKAEHGICKHMWDIRALDAELCDLIHGGTLQVQSDLWFSTSRFTRLRYETTLPSKPKCSKVSEKDN